jgi:hypothetical protein
VHLAAHLLLEIGHVIGIVGIPDGQRHTENRRARCRRSSARSHAWLMLGSPWYWAITSGRRLVEIMEQGRGEVTACSARRYARRGGEA